MAGEQKEWLTTLLLAIFLGGFGAHRFYTGFTKEGVIQLLTCGGCLVWLIIDLVNIITNKFVDAEGRPLLKA
jgi:TM2 domain-containing membrane protein YozV